MSEILEALRNLNVTWGEVAFWTFVLAMIAVLLGVNIWARRRGIGGGMSGDV